MEPISLLVGGALLAGRSWVPCTCRQYLGPRPIDEVFAPRLLPPTAD